MKSILNDMMKIVIIAVLGLVYVWFIVSLAWSRDEMSRTEVLLAIAYSISVLPLYEGIKRVMGLR